MDENVLFRVFAIDETVAGLHVEPFDRAENANRRSGC